MLLDKALYPVQLSVYRHSLKLMNVAGRTNHTTTVTSNYKTEMKKFQLILTFLFLATLGFGQKMLYHEYYTTASNMHIEKWNIDKNNLPDYYVQETVDSENRVTELKFFRNGSLDYVHLCYLSVWIKYEYPNDTTLIAYHLDSNGKEDAEIECNMPSRTTFILSQDKRTILESKSEYNIDKELYLNNGFTEEELDKIIDSLESDNRTSRSVSYYSMSYYKLSGIFPVSKYFEIGPYDYSDKEKEQILESLKK